MPSQRIDSPSPRDACHECGRAVPSDANFCPGCGSALFTADDPVYCPDCGDTFAPDDAFCPDCGAQRPRVPDREAERGDEAVTPEARRAFRRRVRDHTDAGWELTADHGDRVVLVDRGIGSIPVHVLLLLTTGGVGNLLYGWYHYSELAETRRLTVSDGPLPDSELSEPGGTDDPLVALTGYLLGGILVFIGLGMSAVAVGQGAVLGAVFGVAFALVGLWLTPPVERRLDRRHGRSRFGRIRTVDHRITPATERTEAPCVVCGESFERGVVRRRRDETVVAGVPVLTHGIDHNHYCAGCARAELFGGPDGESDSVTDSGALATEAFAVDDGTVTDAAVPGDDPATEREAGGE